MNEPAEILKVAAAIPGWGYVILAMGILSLLLVVLDKTGYYLQRKKGTVIRKDSLSKQDLEDAFVGAIKRYKTNGGGEITPGRADSCISHGEKLVKLESLIPALDQKIEGVDAKVDRNYAEQVRSCGVINSSISGLRKDLRAPEWNLRGGKDGED